jgi:hypothetical protein
MEETLQQLNSNVRPLLANAPGAMKACGIPSLDVSMRELIQGGEYFEHLL